MYNFDCQPLNIWNYPYSKLEIIFLIHLQFIAKHQMYNSFLICSGVRGMCMRNVMEFSLWLILKLKGNENIYLCSALNVIHTTIEHEQESERWTEQEKNKDRERWMSQYPLSG